MKYARHLKLTAVMLLAVPLAGCIHTQISNDVPHCEKLIPAFLLSPVEPAPLPEGNDATPWMEGFVQQTGQLDKANERAPAVNHIYTECLGLHRDALAKSNRKFLGIF